MVYTVDPELDRAAEAEVACLQEGSCSGTGDALTTPLVAKDGEPNSSKAEASATAAEPASLQRRRTAPSAVAEDSAKEADEGTALLSDAKR